MILTPPHPPHTHEPSVKQKVIGIALIMLGLLAMGGFALSLRQFVKYLGGGLMSIRCPKCGATVSRIYRLAWMRILPMSRHYACFSCKSKYLRFMGLMFKVMA